MSWCALFEGNKVPLLAACNPTWRLRGQSPETELGRLETKPGLLAQNAPRVLSALDRELPEDRDRVRPALLMSAVLGAGPCTKSTPGMYFLSKRMDDECEPAPDSLTLTVSSFPTQRCRLGPTPVTIRSASGTLFRTLSNESSSFPIGHTK